MSIRQGVIIRTIVERRLIQKVKHIIKKNIEKKRANNRVLGYTSDNVSPLTVVRSLFHSLFPVAEIITN